MSGINQNTQKINSELSYKDWLKPIQMREIYGFSESWLSKQRMSSSSCTLPYHKVGGKFIFYSRQEVDQWIMEHKMKGAE